MQLRYLLDIRPHRKGEHSHVNVMLHAGPWKSNMEQALHEEFT